MAVETTVPPPDLAGEGETVASLSITSLTPGSVLFAGPGGLISQNNTSFFWDTTERTLLFRDLTAVGDEQYLAKCTMNDSVNTPNFNFIIFNGGNAFGSIKNYHFALGWNIHKERSHPEDLTKPALLMSFEDHYESSLGVVVSEWYVEYQTASATPTLIRPFFAVIDQSTNNTQVNLTADIYTFSSRATTAVVAQLSSTTYALSLYKAGLLNTVVISANTSKMYMTVSGTLASGNTLSYHTEGTVPGFSVYDTGGAANGHLWEMFANGGSWTFRAANDAYNAFGVVFTVARSGVAVSSLTMATHLLFTDNTYDIGASLATRPRTIYPGTSIIFGSAGLLSWSSDLFLQRDAANTLAQRNGTNAQVLSIYGTFTDSSNYERLSVTVGSGSATTFARQQAGTGGVQGMTFNVTGNASMTFSTTNIARWLILGGGGFIANLDNTYDIGNNASTFRPRNLFLGTSISVGTTPAVAGDVRLANTAIIAWRNNANGADITGIDKTSGDIIRLSPGNGAVQIGGSSATIGFYGVTAAARPSAYTQTYATATRTHANMTSSDLTGIASSTTGSALTEPDAIYVQATWQTNMRRIQDQFVALRADVLNLKQVVNSVIDDDQILGLKQ